MIYTTQQKILFKHCDPAGIVFYPRYFEILNDVVESFFYDILKYPFEDVHKRGGVPTVTLNTQFYAPSYHGDILAINLILNRVGQTSLGIEVEMVCKGQRRMASKLVLVNVDGQGKPQPWPDYVKKNANQYIEATA